MDSKEIDREPGQPSPEPGKPRWLLATALYLVAIVGATWPYVLTMRSRLPSLVDPLQHLWVMRWYRTCLTEWKSPLLCPDIQYPNGAPLANFSPLHLQSLLFLGLSAFLNNDILIYNILWVLGFLTAGLGTYALARFVLKNDRAGLLAGLLAMLSGPMMVHSHCHLELMYMGSFPIFMLAWIRFLDQPGARRLALAVGALALVTMSAAYFMVFTTIAATLYVVYRAVAAYRGGDPRWLFQRLGWLGGFSLAAIPPLALLFLPQILAISQGQAMSRPFTEFEYFRAAWWSYLIPVSGNLLATWLPFDPYNASFLTGEGSAYLGMVTLALIYAAAIGRPRLQDRNFWWILLASLILLSMGTFLLYFGKKIPMPAAWLWEWYPPFKLIRVPARFKFFAAVIAALLAGAGWLWLESRFKNAWHRRIAFIGLAIFAVADLAHRPYAAEPVPDVPRGYTWLLQYDPDAVWIDIPHVSSGDPTPPNSICTYWQSGHGGRTTAGYSGHTQWPLDNRMVWNSPFYHRRMADPTYLARPDGEEFDVITGADPLSYIWTYLTLHDLPYVVLHRWSDSLGPFHGFARVQELLKPAQIYEDDLITIYERDRLPRPTKPVLINTDGWLTRTPLLRDGTVRPVSKHSKLVVYNPDAQSPLKLGLRARSLGKPRRARIVHDGQTLAAWTLASSQPDLVSSPNFQLPAGMLELELVVDGATEPAKPLDNVHEPISLLVSGLNIQPATLRVLPEAVAHDSQTDTEIRR